MNEELNYAEMLEIPVETVQVNRREKKKRKGEEELKDRLVEQVNEKMEQEDDPAYCESTPILSEDLGKERGHRREKRILFCELCAVFGLCATIFLTNIFMADSAINVFVRDLFQTSPVEMADTRTYADFTLSSPVNDSLDVEIAVSSTGVLSFIKQCSVYSPCDGEVKSVGGDAENGYTLEIAHSDTFSTIIGGLDAVYLSEGDVVKSNLPVAYSKGEEEVRVMFYQDGNLLNCCTVEGGALSWS